ncbi:hypothetical protein GIS00_13460 [Nakamurella sp. YIM 132087]|uniref:Nucleotidyltransferase family protein n=1 Tax=Nakamurella alba TaxID=2665158 RepID=A0A7K1FLC6_9ACTN|nr:nucleotidyltransferase [Nakamurella alba]MTD14947.1 hypothetical protein [Nakamurella alba]
MTADPAPPAAADEPVQATDRDALRDALKRAASALKDEGIPFAVAGGYALWVHGAPESEHDVDLAVEEPRVEQAADRLARAGFAIERPPEDWLFKAWADGAEGAGAMVDVLHRLNGIPVDLGLLDRAEEHEVLGLRVPVLPAQEVVTGKLLAMTERYCDFSAMIPVVRAVREQIDWDRLTAATRDNDFAAAFLFLVRRLGIAPADES